MSHQLAVTLAVLTMINFALWLVVSWAEKRNSKRNPQRSQRRAPHPFFLVARGALAVMSLLVAVVYFHYW